MSEQTTKPTTTSGAIINLVYHQRKLMKGAKTIPQACFHYQIGSELSELAEDLFSINRLRPQGLERVRYHKKRLDEAWTNIISEIEEIPASSDRDDIEEWRFLLEKANRYCSECAEGRNVVWEEE